MGLRGVRGLRQALGVTGVRCLDRLLQIRINDAMRRLSAILVPAKHGAQNCSVVTTVCSSLACTHAHTHPCTLTQCTCTSFHALLCSNGEHHETERFLALCSACSLLYADVDLSMLDVSKSARSSHVIAPDPAAFKEAVKNGGKLWPIVSHYLAALGQASLIRQRLASDLTTSER